MDPCASESRQAVDPDLSPVASVNRPIELWKRGNRQCTSVCVHTCACIIISCVVDWSPIFTVWKKNYHLSDFDTSLNVEHVHRLMYFKDFGLNRVRRPLAHSSFTVIALGHIRHQRPHLRQSTRDISILLLINLSNNYLLVSTHLLMSSWDELINRFS